MSTKHKMKVSFLAVTALALIASLSLVNCGGGGSAAPTSLSYTVGGTVAGLAGSGLVLQNNGGDDLTVSTNGTFTFATTVANGAAYAVTVKTQPSSPSQTCTASNNTGAMAGANITGVSVVCSAIAVGNSSNTANGLQLSFGTLIAGSTLEHTVTISNAGNASLVISTVTSTPALFSKVTDSCSGQSIAPSGRCTIAVRFSPVSAGTSTGSLSISSNDLNNTPLAITLSGAANATTGVNKVFVTSVTGSGGNMSLWSDATGTGLAAADAVCQSRALASGLAGTFRAWLSDGSDDAYCRMHNYSGKKTANCGQGALPASAGPWIRTDGFPFGATLDHLVAGKVFAPVRYDEFGAPVPGLAFYFTNTDYSGDIHPSYSTPCSNWTSTLNSDSAGGGGTDYTSGMWTNYVYLSCSDATARLLCMQAGAGPALPAFAPTGKKVFLTSQNGSGNLGAWPGAGGKTGLAAGDAICQSLAGAASVTGTFKAWLSDGTTNAVDRLTGNGPWIRLDGVKVADNKADLTDGSLFTAINLTETGTYYDNYGVWSGTTDDGIKTNNHCNNWTEGTVAHTGSYGIAGTAGARWSGSASGNNCDWSLVFLRCFED